MSLNVVLITKYFPNNKGEQFIETEIKYFGKRENINITILPMRKVSGDRFIPDNCKVDKSLYLHKSALSRGMCLYKALYSKIFYKELFSEVLKNPLRLGMCFSSFSSLIRYYIIFDEFIKKEKKEKIVFYTYWHNEATYALQLLKNKYKIKIVTRCHRTDLYEELKKHKYMPFRKQFNKNLDKVFTISDESLEYNKSRYGFSSSSLFVSRLGVNDLKIKTESTLKQQYTIISCSGISSVKRIDRIVRALVDVAIVLKDIEIKWIHIGDGKLEQEIKNLADELLGNIKNLTYTF